MNNFLQQNWPLHDAKGSKGIFQKKSNQSLWQEKQMQLLWWRTAPGSNCNYLETWQWVTLKQTSLDEARVLQSDTLVLVIQNIIITQGIYRVFCILLTKTLWLWLCCLDGYLRNNSQDSFSSLRLNQFRNTSGNFRRWLWKNKQQNSQFEQPASILESLSVL